MAQKSPNAKQYKRDSERKIEGEWDSPKKAEAYARTLRFSTKVFRLHNGKYGLARQ